MFIRFGMDLIINYLLFAVCLNCATRGRYAAGGYFFEMSFWRFGPGFGFSVGIIVF